MSSCFFFRAVVRYVSTTTTSFTTMSFQAAGFTSPTARAHWSRWINQIHGPRWKMLAKLEIMMLLLLWSIRRLDIRRISNTTGNAIKCLLWSGICRKSKKRKRRRKPAWARSSHQHANAHMFRWKLMMKSPCTLHDSDKWKFQNENTHTRLRRE